MAEFSLADSNSATLGVKMPEVTLPDGSVVQTGTVGALLVNIEAYNAAHAQQDQEQLKVLESKIRLSVPLLHKVGLFDLFKPEEWIAGDNEGRKLVGKLALSK